MTAVDGSTGRAAGYTLVEMMLVAVIMGIMAMMATAASPESGEYRLNLIQTEIADAVDHAKALSRSSREAHGVVFDPAGERLAVVDADGSIVTDTLTKAAYLVDFSSSQYPRGIDIVSADFGDAGQALVVDPDGEALSSGSVEISFGKARRTLTVERATVTLSGS